ncbi:MAG: hypothetical protein HQ518_00660 [Rhodopirellula sp.]|nr:hypothetical protein [Rhodopirellula sp.]
MMHRDDNTHANRVHPEHPDLANSVDRSATELAALVAGSDALPESVRVTMLALLDVSGDIDQRLADCAGKLLRVRRWDEHFEVAQTRKIKGVPKWIALPVKHDGSRYRRLIEGPNGAARFGVWTLLCQVAMKCRVRGTLADEDGPLSIEDISLKTGCPLVSLLDALPALLSIGWLEIIEADNAAPGDVTTNDATEVGESSGTFRNPETVKSPETTLDPKRTPDLVIPAELSRLVEQWNSLPPDIAKPVESRELPSLCSAWESIHRSQKAANARELLSDSEAVIEAVRGSPFVHGKPWFSLSWLLRRERDGPKWNIEKLAAGYYRDEPAANGRANQTLEALSSF